MEDIRTKSLKRPVDVAEYLFRRLKMMGVQSIHGVPGDYNLVMLDYVPLCGMTWVGNCNELNAAYAADGYARVGGLGAVVTTFGVGELSAINGIAGAYSEMIPVVHIVGCPSTVSQKNGMLLHHTLGNGDFNVFANMSREICCNVAKLNHPAEIANQIDDALRECWVQSRPVYLMLPTDMVQQKIEGERLDTPIDLAVPPNDPAKEDYVVDVVLRSLYAAKDPVLLVDACAIRHKVLPEVHELLHKLNVSAFVTPMGKGAIDESDPRFGGVYAGEASDPSVRDVVEHSDLILFIGALKTDFNTAGFTYRTSQLNTIDFHSTHCVVRYSEYPGVRMKGVLRKVVEKMDMSKLPNLPQPRSLVTSRAPRDTSDVDAITQTWLWPKVGDFLKENDIVVTETGTANFGIWSSRFPQGVTAISQVLWGSIGYAVGACQGAALAARDAQDRGGHDVSQGRRTILFEGDGSLQLTAQEISTMIRHGLKPIIFLLNNDGYTIERFIHGMDAAYNDVANWHYPDLVTVFGGTDETARKFRVTKKDELEKLLGDEEFNAAEQLQFVEVLLSKDDAPEALKLVGDAAARTNARLE